MKKIGIVSSFDVLCGNATYSEALANALEKHTKVEKIAIPTSLQKKHQRQKIQKILEQVIDCDAINMQMELGLYGPTPKKAQQLIKNIFRHAKQLSVTMHRIDPEPAESLLRAMYNTMKQGGKLGPLRALTEMLPHMVKNTVYKTYKTIILSTHRKGGTFIVHTYREKARVLNICPDAKVMVHPIIWPESMPSDTTINIAEKFTNNRPIIGLFGFLSPYKNFESVIQLANDVNYNVVVGGGTHPHSPKYGLETKKSTAKILSNTMIGNPKESGAQFYHHTAPDNATLIHLIKSVDIVVVPYFETGQSGSGVASLAIQYGKRVIFSDTALIYELTPFLSKKPFVFDVNSPAGLAFAIEDALQYHQANSVYFKDHSFATNIQTYLSSLSSGDERP